MADFVPNHMLGRVRSVYDEVESGETSAAFVVLLLQDGVEEDKDLADYKTVADLVAENDEADFDNYARITLTSEDLSSLSEDDTDDLLDIGTGLEDLVWEKAGVADPLQKLAKIVFALDPDAPAESDDDLEPYMFFDFVTHADGWDLYAQPNVDGLLRVTSSLSASA